MDLGVQGKVAIVNGASRGIGLGIARMLSREGAQVVISARRAAPLEATAAALRAETGGQVLAVAADTRNAADCERIVAQAMQTFGRVDILVNNGGAPALGPTESFSDEDWEQALQRNFFSVVRMVRNVLPHMRAAGSGRIVNITALSVRQPLVGFNLSAATWAGVIGFSKTLSLEIGAAGITINTILPGRFETERLTMVNAERAAKAGKTPEEMMEVSRKLIPVGRFGKTEEIAALVACLVSSHGSFITGTVIQADGGQQANIL